MFGALLNELLDETRKCSAQAKAQRDEHAQRSYQSDDSGNRWRRILKGKEDHS